MRLIKNIPRGSFGNPKYQCLSHRQNRIIELNEKDIEKQQIIRATKESAIPGPADKKETTKLIHAASQTRSGRVIKPANQI